MQVPSVILDVPVHSATGDRVGTALARRLDAARQRRRLAALDPCTDQGFCAWCREIRRADALTRALIHHRHTHPPTPIQL